MQERWHDVLVARYERKNPDVKTLLESVGATRQEWVTASGKEREVRERIFANTEVYKADLGSWGVVDKIPEGYVRVEKSE